MAIDRTDFAEDCVRQGLFCGANPHYMLGVAQLRSGISEGAAGKEIGPFRLTPEDWNAHCTDAEFNLNFLPSDISDPDMQIPVFAVMARRAFDAFVLANNRNPSARELYLQQFPSAPTATLSADLLSAFNATAPLVDTAAAAVLDDQQSPPPKITNPDQQIPGGVTHPAGPSGSGGGVTGVFNPKFNAFFTALVPGGFFSSDPDDLHVLRSVRTNNPGALNISDWQRPRPGFVGVTQDDGHGNKTTIYCAPEYGIASWYHLLAVRYGFAQSGGAFTIDQLARSYAGQNAAQSTVANYVNQWCRLADNSLTGQSVVHLNDDNEMLNLARAMFKNEASAHLRIGNDQILFGIQNERNNSLPPPPAPPAANVAAGNSGGSSSGS